MLMSTWTGGQPPATAKTFFAWLDDMALDFRVARTFLSRVKFAVFGLGNSEYDEDFCAAAAKMDKNLRELGGVRLCRYAPRCAVARPRPRQPQRLTPHGCLRSLVCAALARATRTWTWTCSSESGLRRCGRGSSASMRS